MNLSAWIPKIQVIPLRDTKPCGFAAGGKLQVESVYRSETSRILQAITEAKGNGYGYVSQGLTFLLTHNEWEQYAKETEAPAYETQDGVYVIFQSGTVPREWKPWLHDGWYVPYEGEGITQLKIGKAGILPETFLPREHSETFSDFDHDIDWIVRKTFEAGKRNDKTAYAGILAIAGQEWDLLMQQAWKAGQMRYA